MTKSGRPPRGRALSREDQELWAAVSKGIQPVRKRGRVQRVADDEASPQWPVPNQSDEPTSARDQGPDVREPSAVVEPRKPPAPPPAPTHIEPRRARKIASGRLKIEARLDLHGMYQSEAHAQLNAFIMKCYSRAQRHVLVVTGKGVASDDDRPFEMEGRRDRGVLRRNVPMWLAEPALRRVVVSFTTAHARHGGEGALYVQIRSPHRMTETSE